MNHSLADELARMHAEDQRLRRPAPGEALEVNPHFSYERDLEIARSDVVHVARLKEIVGQHGWPGRSLVGEDGAMHAWLIVQHADRELTFQREMLELITRAFEAGEMEGRELALLTDRVRLNSGLPQVFGSQIRDVVDGQVIPHLTEDPDRLDERRASLALEPFAEYATRWLAYVA